MQQFINILRGRLSAFTIITVAAITPHLAIAEKGETEVAKKILSISDNGLSSSEIEVSTASGSLFILNSTSDSLLTIVIEFGSKRGHCWSKNLEFNSGKLRSTAPFGPEEFSLMCFPEEGAYPFTVFGLNIPDKHKQSLTLHGVIHARAPINKQEE